MTSETNTLRTPDTRWEAEQGSWLSSARSVPFGDFGPSLVGFDETDPNLRPLKLMRSTLTRRLKEEGCRVVGVTSPLPNTGKSFVASNLAASMSRISRSAVVLTDLDLQRPSLSDYFPAEPSSGVVDFLTGEESSLGQIAQRIEGTDLFVLPTFRRECASAELLSSERFDTLMSEIRTLDEGVLVFCDMPPLFVNDDAMLISEKLDAVILVVEQSVTTKKQLETAVDIVRPTKIIGTIMNRFTGQIGDDYGYYGSYGYY